MSETSGSRRTFKRRRAVAHFLRAFKRHAGSRRISAGARSRFGKKKYQVRSMTPLAVTFRAVRVRSSFCMRQESIFPT